MFYAYPIGWVECNISILKNVIFIHEKSSYLTDSQAAQATFDCKPRVCTCGQIKYAVCVITRYAGVQPTWTNCTRAEIVNVKEYFRKHTFCGYVMYT